MPKYKSILDAPTEVITRFYRRRVILKLSPHIEALTLRYSRIKLILKERDKNKALRDALNTYKNVSLKTSKEDNECMNVLMNMGLFFLLAESDIQALKIDALTHPNEWKRKLSLRIILLTIHEWDMGKVSNKNLKNLLTQSKVTPELQVKLFESLRMLKKAQRKAAKILYEPRNSVIAHRDPNALYQLETIEALDAELVFGAVEDFYKSSEAFLEAFTNVLLEAGSLKGLLAFRLNEKK